MALDVKKFTQPKFLIVGGIAVVAGLYLATKFRPKSQEPAEVVATPISQPYAVANQIDAYHPSVSNVSSPSPTPQPKPIVISPARTPPPVPRPSPIPVRPPTPVPQPTPNPSPIEPSDQFGLPVPCPPGFHRDLNRSSATFNRCVRNAPVTPPSPIPIPGTPRPNPTPPAPGPPPTAPNVPGGYIPDCRGVLPRPANHPGADILGFAHSYVLGVARGRRLAVGWSIQGIGSNDDGPGAWWSRLQTPVLYGSINATRRNRGLKPLTDAEFAALKARFLVMVSTGSEARAYSDDNIVYLWNTFHLPYLCP